MRLAAIDIGSNAARLLISDVTHHENKPQFQKINLVRVPLRLGFDVFEEKDPARQRGDDHEHHEGVQTPAGCL